MIRLSGNAGCDATRGGTLAFCGTVCQPQGVLTLHENCRNLPTWHPFFAYLDFGDFSEE